MSNRSDLERLGKVEAVDHQLALEHMQKFVGHCTEWDWLRWCNVYGKYPPPITGGKFLPRSRSWKRGSAGSQIDAPHNPAYRFRNGKRRYFNLAYSALASLRTGMSGSASFQRPRN